MFRIDGLRLLLAAFFVSLGLNLPPVVAEPLQVHVALVVGDTESAAAIEAVQTLRADPHLKGFAFHVVTPRALAKGATESLALARVVFVQTVGRNLSMTVAPFVPDIVARGGVVYAVGPSWDDDMARAGFSRDEVLSYFMRAGGPQNMANMARLALKQRFGLDLAVAPPRDLPEIGGLDLASGDIVADFDALRARMPADKRDRPWIGLAFYRSNALSGQLATVRALAAALDARGYNAAPFFGFPNEPTLEKFAFDRAGRPVFAAIGALSLKISNNPGTLGPLLDRIDAPVVNLITLNSQSEAQWLASPQGLDTVERAWQVGNAEYGGLTAPTVVAAKEVWRDPETGLEGVREKPIAERFLRAADRLAALARLRALPNADKRIALLYYNYPPGKATIGASYLNVLPQSLLALAGHLRDNGFRIDDLPEAEKLIELIRDGGGNIARWSPGSLDALVRAGVKSGFVQLLPVETYEKWLEQEAPKTLRDAMNAKWGEPQNSKVMVWRDPEGRAFFVFPAFRFGNLLLAPQPSRGWEQNVESLYHDVTLPPHHQYLAFYLWLRRAFQADAMIHLGTHATHEWLSGKEVGLSGGDPGEIVVGATPQFYPYIVDDVGEAIQAKRRGMATIVSHMIPPLDKAGVAPQLKEITQLLSDHRVAQEKSPLVAAGLLDRIEDRARALGLLKDLGVVSLRAQKDSVEKLDDHIREISERATPFGLHTFGRAPDEAAMRKSAEAIAAPLQDSETISRLIAAMRQSAKDELDHLVRGLSGRHVPAGPGNDPARTPESLPTGRNLYGFDPTRLPTPAAWAIGEKLASDLVRDFHARKSAWPDKYVFNLWGVESSRHEGVMEAQIMTLLGVRPQWDARGKIKGLEPIPRAVLGRPRVDVAVIPSGLYRDMFPVAMKWLDEAVTLSRVQDEADNAIRRHFETTRAELLAQGIGSERAEKLAGVRLFSVPSGAYGANLDKAIPLSNTYGEGKEADAKLSDLYFLRMHHAFGQGLWGDSVADRPDLGVDLLKGALRGAQGVIHSRSSKIYGALDGDDFYQYLGGTALAARAVNGATPEVLVTDMADPKAARTETLEHYLGREMRARYLNPKWIEAMMKEGYAGAAFVTRMVENLYGWQVTTPEAVGDEKWQEIYETWVKDRNKLDIAQKFRDAKNLPAYQALVDRMLVAVNKGFWRASVETVADLDRLNRALIAEAGAACDKNTCSSPEITALAEQRDRKAAEPKEAAPSATQIAANVARAAAEAPAPNAPTAAAKGEISGYLMEEKTGAGEGQTPPETPLAGWILLIAALGGGVRRIVGALF
ncbi:cobaltochelatase subunit CobN [Rhodoblastus acidophilus]|uniref:Cobaltochelatase subunit CobN n=1 Tax=Rhodoblastus acidophilus TaxID=1074 RepID=A0A6N8DLX5_RHOAC|nr:cobaltochelatase subunit CobN [Rhodoblastus acidophilus]MCW2274832.1 cobaltochelatase CobN [Rhodoblastus acidophilus]MTV31582.1 cobaltochelatase subunit CobN [Rhodoblastus acidophilus]